MKKILYDKFLKTNTSSFPDEWVALTKEKVIAHDKDINKLYSKIEKAHNIRDVLFFKVPGRQALYKNKHN